MFRSVSFKVSQMFGFIIVGLMIINILVIILRNIGQIDVYAMFKIIIPEFVKNLIVGAILITPVTYSLQFGVSNSPFTNIAGRGTFMTRIMEAIFSMFYNLGLIFFNDSRIKYLTPGELGMLFFIRPITLLEHMFGFMTFFSLFINIGKLVLLLFCLWSCGKIIAIYIANIFISLMLTTFSIVYMVFLTLEETKSIGMKGINIIIVQSVVMFLTVAMLGLSYQVMNLVVVSDSIEGIASLCIIFYILQQLMQNINSMAISITTGGGLGQGRGTEFSDLGQAVVTLMGGLVQFGSVKLDELTDNKRDKEKDKAQEEKDKKERIMSKARQNVGSIGYTGEVSNKKGFGVSFRSENTQLKNAEESMKSLNKKREEGAGNWYRGGLAATTLLKVMTGDLSDVGFMIRQGKELKNIFSNSENSPYNVMSNEQRRIEARVIMANAWGELWNRLGDVDLSSGTGSMSEGMRISTQNYEGSREEKRRLSEERSASEIRSTDYSYYNNTYYNPENWRYMENLNRSRIMNSENERIMIENAIKRYRESISENKDTIDDTG